MEFVWKMKTRIKIITIVVIVIAVIVLILAGLPVVMTMTIILCDGKIMSQDDCGNYLEEKYLKLPQAIHFRDMYPDPPGLGFETINFKAVRISATSSMEEKRVADLVINLEDSSMVYRCYDFNLSEDDHITVDITNPTIDDMSNNYCLKK